MRAGRRRSSAGKPRPRRSRARRWSSCIATRRTCATGSASSKWPRSSPSPACRRPRPTSARWSASSPPTPPRLILLNAYNDPKAANWLSERVHAPAVVLPFSVGGIARSEGSVRPVRRHHQQAAGGRQMNDMLTDFSILLPALIAGCLVAISHVPLGQQVLSRGIVFIDLAIAQVAGARRHHRQQLSSCPSKGGARRSPPAPPRWPARCCSPGPSASGPRCRRR